MSTVSHQETALRYGEDSYNQGKLEDAFSAFRKVILLCSCNQPLRISSKRLGISSRDIPLPICHCKDYLALPIDNPDSSFTDKEAIFKLATQPCSCGSGIVPCHNASHIKALVSIANVYVSQKTYIKAMQYASLAITLAPHLPEGYLRIVTVIRQGQLKCTPDITSRCNWLDTQASHSVRAHGDKNHEMLKPIGRRIRRDIVRGLPAEIRQMILQKLSQVDICRAMRVSKVWRTACRDRQLWKDLRLVKNWRHTSQRPPLRPGMLNNIVRLSGHMATSLTIDGLWDFKFNGDKLRAMLKTLPELKILALSGRHSLTPLHTFRPRATGIHNFCDFWGAIWESAPANLATLHLSSFDIRGDWQDPRPRLETARFQASLKEFSISRLHCADVCMAIDEIMSKSMSINTMIIKDCKWDDEPSHAVVTSLPEHPYWRSLTLDGVLLGNRSSAEQWHADWGCLERLILGEVHTEGTKLPTSKILRSLELNHDGLSTLDFLMWREEGEKPHLPDLEHFRCHFNPHQELSFNLQNAASDTLSGILSLLAILRPSIANGTLRYLDLTFSKDVKVAVDALYHEQQEANHKEAVQILCCYEITMPSIVTGFGGNCDEVLDWIDTFPNLTTVGAYPQKSENAHMLILWLMSKRPDIKTIYTNVLKGADRDSVLAEAQKKHITIIHADRVPEPILERRT